MTASEAVTRTQVAWAGGIVTDPKMAISVTQSEILALTANVDNLSLVLQSSGLNPTKYSVKEDKATDPEKKTLTPDIPPLPTPKNGASSWQSIVILSTHDGRKSENTLSTSSSHVNAQAGGWFWSVGHSSDKTEGSGSEVGLHGLALSTKTRLTNMIDTNLKLRIRG